MQRPHSAKPTNRERDNVCGAIYFVYGIVGYDKPAQDEKEVNKEEPVIYERDVVKVSGIHAANNADMIQCY